MALKFKSIFSSLLGAILALLGFDSCKKLLGEGGIGTNVCMYGCPYSELTLKGTVTDKQSNPLEGISVAVLSPKEMYTDTLFKGTTGSDGKISAEFNDYGFSDMKNLQVELTDVDGPENGGQFSARKVNVSAKQTRKGDGAWKTGEYEISFTEALERE